MKPGPDLTYHVRLPYPNTMSDKDLESQGALIRKLKEPSAPDPYPAFTKKANECAENMKYGIELCKYKVGESGLYECLEDKKQKLDECWQNTKDNVSDYVNDKWEKTTDMAKHVMERGDEALLNSLPYTEKHYIVSGRAREEERREHERKLEEMRREYPEMRLFVYGSLSGKKTAQIYIRGNEDIDNLCRKVNDSGNFKEFRKIIINDRAEDIRDIAGDTLESKHINENSKIMVVEIPGGGTRKRRGKRQKPTRKRTAMTRKRRRKGTRKKRYSK